MANAMYSTHIAEHHTEASIDMKCFSIQCGHSSHNHVVTLAREFCNENMNDACGIAERCDFLDKFSKIVDYKLNYYLDKHYDEICILYLNVVAGVSKIESLYSMPLLRFIKMTTSKCDFILNKIEDIKNDIESAHDCVVEARKRTKTLINAFEINIIKLAILQERKLRMQKIKESLFANFKSCVDNCRRVHKALRFSLFNEAQERLLLLKKSISNNSKTFGSGLTILESLKKKAKSFEAQIRQGIKRGLIKIILKFSSDEYSEISKYYERIMNKKNAKNSLIEDIRSQYSELVLKNVSSAGCSPVTPGPTPLLLPPGVPPADHVQLFSLEEGQQSVAQAPLPHIRHCVGVALYQTAAQPSLHVLHCRSEEHTSVLQSPRIISYAVLCLKKKKKSVF